MTQIRSRSILISVIFVFFDEVGYLVDNLRHSLDYPVNSRSSGRRNMEQFYAFAVGYDERHRLDFDSCANSSAERILRFGFFCFRFPHSPI